MMTVAAKIDQHIECIAFQSPDGIEEFVVDGERVTLIEEVELPGEYSMIPYIRVWRNETCIAEFNKHKLQYILYGKAKDG